MFRRMRKSIAFAFSTIKAMPGVRVRLASLIGLSVISSVSSIGLTYFFFEYSGTAALTEIGINSILYMAGGMTVLICLEPLVENVKSKLLVPIRIHTSSSFLRYYKGGLPWDW